MSIVTRLPTLIRVETNVVNGSDLINFIYREEGDHEELEVAS